MLKFGDRARQTTTTTGTGTISLTGSAPAGWFTFAESGLVSGRTCRYLIELPNGSDFAICEGIFTSGSPSTLTRTRIVRSKIGGVAGATNPSLTGTSTVTCVWTAEDADAANPVLFAPAISAGALVIDLDRNAESAHKVTLNANVIAGGISFVNPPSGYCKVYIEFNQATPGGTLYDVPITAWTGGPGTITFDTEYAVYQDATPTVVWLTSTDGMATARARMNVELIAYLSASDVDDTPVNGATTAPVSSNWAFDHAALITAHGISSFGSSLVDDADASAARTTLGLGTAATQSASAFEAAGAVFNHAALTQTHGISVFGASLVDDANAATARTTLGLGTAATAATGDFAPAAQGVTNGNNHDHSGGDGAQIAYSSLSGTPTLGGAASLNVGTGAGTVAAGNDSRLSDSRAPTAHASTHQSGGSDPIRLDDLAAPDDNTDLDATTLRHGLLPKLGGGTTNYLRADGTWAAPAGGGGAGAESGLVIAEATTLGGVMSCYFVEASTLG